ncbi:hypothetical protein CBS101457_006300 [Exobasidium rhododendri]|nr:hypothetical protein CBS101457_006300 [Exobasidium rhododendri]
MQKADPASPLVTSRESTYSDGRFSGIVTTASAMSIQRAAAQTRTMGERTGTPSPRGVSVDKGIGVKTRRRKSRDATSTTKRSSRQSSAHTSTSAGGARDDEKLLDFIETSGVSKSTSQPMNKTSLTASRIPRISAEFDRGKLSLSAQENIPINANKRLSSKLISSASKSLTLTPLDISRAGNLAEAEQLRSPNSTTYDSQLSAGRSPCGNDRFHSPSTSSFALGRHMSTLSTQSSIQVLSPYSDAWGQNSSVAAEKVNQQGHTTQSFPPEYFSPSSTPRPRGASVTSAASSFVSRRSNLASTTLAKGSGSPYRHQNYPSSVTSLASRDHQPRSKESGAYDGLSEKDRLLNQLLASLTLVDSQSYESFHSLEEVESYKKEIIRVEKRVIDVQHKLKVEMRVRDAAEKLRRAGTRKAQHDRNQSVASNHGFALTSSHSLAASLASTTAPTDAGQVEIDVVTATKRTDAICKELIELKEKAMLLRRRLLEHQTRVLALRLNALEAENADRWQAMEEEENDKVGANLAMEELEKVRDKLQRVEQNWEHEKRDREEEVSRWRKKYEEEKVLWKEEHEGRLHEWDKKMMEAERHFEISSQQIKEDHGKASRAESVMRRDVEVELEKQAALSALREKETIEMRAQIEQFEFEMTAERKIMQSRQQLFTAFEKRLNRAETRLREQDDRCAQLLGKVDGREEMDKMLDQIKSGYGAVKKEKTAGQDIDELISSITTHIGDMEDELHRGGGGGGGEQGYDGNTIHALETRLETTEEELESWKREAESAKRSLAAMQRQSSISLVNSARLSTNFRSPKLRSGSFLSAQTTTEAESRLALMERKSAALEEELIEARTQAGVRDPPNSPPIKVAGSSSSTGDVRDLETYSHALQNLASILPNLDPNCTDLHYIEDCLHRAGSVQIKQETPAKASQRDDVEERCQEVVVKSRALVSVSSRLVDRSLNLEAQREDFERAVVVMEEKCTDLRSALEDLKRGKATQLAREKKLQSAVSELRKSLSVKGTLDFGFPGSRSSVASTSRGGNASILIFRAPSQNHNPSATTVSKRRKMPQPLSIAPTTNSLSFTPSSSFSDPSTAAISTPSAATKKIRSLPKTPASTTFSSPQFPHRTITLGMDDEQLRVRIRDLEIALIQSKSKNSSPTPSFSQDSGAQDELIKELEENRRELEYVKGVESRQRIDLLDELTSLTGELAEARAHLRNEQRKNMLAMNHDRDSSSS